MGGRAVDTMGGGGGVRYKQLNKSEQEFTRMGQQKLLLTLPRQGIEPRVFGIEFRLSNHWASSAPTVSALWVVSLAAGSAHTPIACWVIRYTEES